MHIDINKKPIIYLLIITCVLVGTPFYIFYLSTKAASIDAISGGIGGILGGIIGALGAAWAVYLTITTQTKDEKKRIYSAVVNEVSEISRVIVGHLETCENIRTGKLQIPVAYFHRIFPIPPAVIYPALADKLGVVESSQIIVAFYCRVAEVKYTIEMELMNPDNSNQNTILKQENIQILVELLSTIASFALMIIEGNIKNFDEQVIGSVRRELNVILKETKIKFHLDNAFTTVKVNGETGPVNIS